MLYNLCLSSMSNKGDTDCLIKPIVTRIITCEMNSVIRRQTTRVIRDVSKTYPAYKIAQI